MTFKEYWETYLPFSDPYKTAHGVWNYQQERIDKLEEALRFYASPDNYNHFPATSDPDCMSFVGFIEEQHPGQTARKALGME